MKRVVGFLLIMIPVAIMLGVVFYTMAQKVGVGEALLIVTVPMILAAMLFAGAWLLIKE